MPSILSAPLAAFDAVVEVAAYGVSAVADLLSPALGDAATAGAIVACTLLVRLLLLPFGRAAARASRARLALRPKEAELRRQHQRDPGRLRRELAALHKQHGVSPLSGIAPALAQLPFFAVLYRLFASPTIGDHANLLFTHTLFGVPLSHRFGPELFRHGLLPPDLFVYAVGFLLIGAVAWWSARQSRQAMAVSAPELPPAASKLAGLLPYGTLIAAAFVPLAAALYLLTSTTWSVLERQILSPAGRSA